MNKYDNYINRAQMLMSQDRWDLAEESLRSAIGEDPDRGTAYSLLAAIRLHSKLYAEAQELAERGLGMDPDDAYAHYMLSMVLYQRDQYKPAQDSIDAALSIAPHDADLHSHKAAIAIQQYAWKEALEFSESGLQFDPDHVGCNNFRAIALTKLGRREEAGATIDSALAASPEDSMSHANMGWTKLHDGQAKEAAEHFREALRLEPDNQWAREGIIEALKAKNVFYRQTLRYMLWVSRFSARTQMMMFVGIIILLQVMVRMPAGSVLGTVGVLLTVVYMVFVASIWLASPLFDLLLRFSRYGRMVLTAEKFADTNYMALALFVVSIMVLVPIVTGFRLNDVIAYCLLLIPVAVTLDTSREAKRNLAAAITIAIFAAAVFHLVRWHLYPGIEGLNGPGNLIAFLDNDTATDDPRFEQIVTLSQNQNQLQTTFLWPAVIMSWLGGYFQQRSR